MRTKYVGVVHLPADLYQRLERVAEAQERDPLQQVRWLLKQALDAEPTQPGRRLVAAARIGDDGPRAA